VSFCRLKIYLCSILFLLVPLSSSFAASEKITLTLWEFSASEQLLRSLLKQFEATHPNITVNVQQLSWEHGLEKIVVSIAAGNAPDVVELGTDWVSKFVDAKLLEDLTQETADLRESYFLWESVTANDRIYGVPWLAGTRLLFYNRDLFRQAGLDPERPPKTWKELLEAAQKIHDPKKGIYGFSLFVGEPYSPWQEFFPFAWGNGATLLSKDQRRCLIDEPPMVEALSFYQKLKPYSLVDRQSQVNTLFANGKVGMQISGAWNFRLIPRLNPELHFGVALLPKPAADRGMSAAFAGGEILTLLKHSPHPHEAMALIRFLINEENTIEVVKLQQNVLPTFKNALRHPYFQNHPYQKLFFEQMKSAVAPPLHPSWFEIQEILTQAIEEAIIQNVPPERVLGLARKRIDTLLAGEKKYRRLNDRIMTALLAGGLILMIGFLFLKWKKRPRLPSQTALRNSFSTLFFLSPWLVIFFVFTLYPLLYSIVISFSRYDLLSGTITFSGIQNYQELLKDREFHNALWHTLFFAVGTTPFTLLLALVTAILIHRKIPLKNVFQAGLFLPVSTSVIVIATLFTYLYSPEGPLNTLLDQAGLPKPDPSFLVHPQWALPSMMAMNIWASFGYYMILILAGLQAIPDSLYEAAAIDGASEWERLIHITLPQLRPILLFVVMINTIYSLQVFPEVLTMTQGGPLGATRTVVYHLYETGFRKFHIGLASAIGYLLFLITMMFSLGEMRLFKMGEDAGE